MSTKRRVLFLCTGNSARSQMAEGLVNSLLGDCWEAYSAGTQPATSVHPLAVAAMEEWGIDISHQQPKSLGRFQHARWDVVITLCDDAASACPLWVGAGTVTHMAFSDPAQALGALEDRLNCFREVRDAIGDKVVDYLQQTDNCPDKENSHDS
ncbi:MAG TPA: arsenate reductase ArsC [Chloroflexi bacterium]|nr:arsenate reductase ArsC [Chloroflexota bacterium]